MDWIFVAFVGLLAIPARPTLIRRLRDRVDAIVGAA
jgi:hypothetical protein